ncbi:MAG: DUF402 domain-containing protein [Chloroflexia bacterium]
MLTVVARKYDGTARFRLELEMLHRSPQVVLALGSPGRRFERPGELIQRPSNWSLNYLPLDMPYNIVGYYDSDGELLYHFCNVLTSVEITVGVLQYVDLDLDVVVPPDGDPEVHDRDEFEANARTMNYPQHVRDLAEAAAQELAELACAGGHVFGCRRLEEAEARLFELYVGRE